MEEKKEEQEEQDVAVVKEEIDEKDKSVETVKGRTENEATERKQTRSIDKLATKAADRQT